MECATSRRIFALMAESAAVIPTRDRCFGLAGVCDRVEVPESGHASEFVFSARLEGQAGSGDKVLDRLGDAYLEG
jgi:hypothetical protein